MNQIKLFFFAYWPSQDFFFLGPFPFIICSTIVKTFSFNISRVAMGMPEKVQLKDLYKVVEALFKVNEKCLVK